MENQNMMSGGMTSKTQVVLALIVGLVLGLVIANFMPKSVTNQKGEAITTVSTTAPTSIAGGCFGTDGNGNPYVGTLNSLGNCVPNTLLSSALSVVSFDCVNSKDSKDTLGFTYNVDDPNAIQQEFPFTSGDGSSYTCGKLDIRSLSQNKSSDPKVEAFTNKASELISTFTSVAGINTSNPDGSGLLLQYRYKCFGLTNIPIFVNMDWYSGGWFSMAGGLIRCGFIGVV